MKNRTIYFPGLNVAPLYKYRLVFAVITGATIFLTHLSYTYFEKYFMNLKKRFVIIRSSPTRTLAT